MNCKMIDRCRDELEWAQNCKNRTCSPYWLTAYKKMLNLIIITQFHKNTVKRSRLFSDILYKEFVNYCKEHGRNVISRNVFFEEGRHYEL